MTHDQLHSRCFLWLWNTHPELRGLFHTNFSDFKLVERMLGALAGVKISAQQRQIVLSQLKSIGLVKGTWDFEFLYKNTLYFIEIKVGTDHLSPEQIANKEILEKHGARFFECRTEQEFIDAINQILQS